MATDINLLPTEFKTSKEVTRASGTLSKLTIVLAVLLLIVGAAGGGYVYYLTTQASSAVSRQNDLARTVQNLQSSEQKLVLVKDRISKLSSVISARQKYTLISKYDSLVASASNFEEVELSEGVPKLSVSAADSNTLRGFLDTVSSSSEFSRAYIESIEYREGLGYTITMQLE